MKSGIILLLATFFVLVFDYQSGNSQSVPDENRQIVLRLVPGPDNPRNSEGSFITLKDGRILFIYSHFTGDHVLLAYCAGSQTGRAHLSTTNIARLSLNRIYQSNTK